MNESKTARGFALNTLTDNYGNEFSVQKSSSATDDFVWVGVTHPRVEVGPPWRPFEMPANALIHSRAHLNREQAREVATALIRFAETGELCIATQPDELAQLRAERDHLRARVAELEAPPVVPEGWCVSRSARGWIVSHTRLVNDEGRVAAYRAGAWAIEHDQCPPHAGDNL